MPLVCYYWSSDIEHAANIPSLLLFKEIVTGNRCSDIKRLHEE